MFSFFSGMLVPFISKIKRLNLNYVLALIIAGFAAVSFIKAEGSHRTQILAIVPFAPASVAGGFFYTRRKR